MVFTFQEHMGMSQNGVPFFPPQGNVFKAKKAHHFETYLHIDLYTISAYICMQVLYIFGAGGPWRGHECCTWPFHPDMPKPGSSAALSRSTSCTSSLLARATWASAVGPQDYERPRSISCLTLHSPTIDPTAWTSILAVAFRYLV